MFRANDNSYSIIRLATDSTGRNFIQLILRADQDKIVVEKAQNGATVYNKSVSLS